MNKFVRKLFTVLFAACELYKGTATNKHNFLQTFEIEENFFTGDFAGRVLCCCTAPSEKSVVEKFNQSQTPPKRRLRLL